MSKQNYQRHDHLNSLIFEYEAMSQKGAVCFLEKTVFWQLIDYYEDREEIKKALEVIEVATKQHLFSSEFHFRKSQLLTYSKDYAAALVALDEAQKLAPLDIDIPLRKTEIYIKQKQFDVAAQILEGLREVANKQDLCKIYLCQSYIFEGQEEYVKMLHALRRAIILNPQYDTAFERLWFVSELHQLHESAIKIYHKVLEKDAYSWLAWFNLGHCYACLEKFQEAAEAYDFALTINEEFEYIYRDFAQVCIELGAHQKALDLFLLVTKKFGADSDLCRLIGDCYEALAMNDQAQYYFNEAIKKDPFNDNAHFKLGLCFIRSEHWHRSIKPLEEACLLNQYNEEYVASLAMAYANIHLNEEAITQYLRATEMAPEKESCWNDFIHFLYQEQNYHFALEIIEEAEINTGSNQFIFLKAACYFEIGKIDKACLLLEIGLSENVDQHEMIFSLNKKFLSNKKIARLLLQYLPQGF